MNWFIENWHFILAVLSLIVTIVTTTLTLISRFKAFKNAKTTEEKQKILEDIKESVHGLVDVAEVTFSEVKKSGPSKLLYVLNNIENMCDELGIAFEEEYWTNFINKLISTSNQAVIDKENEKKTKELIEEVKTKISSYVDNANQLFKYVPIAKAYKIDYVLRLIKQHCGELELNVYDEFDWETLVATYFKED